MCMCLFRDVRAHQRQTEKKVFSITHGKINILIQNRKTFYELFFGENDKFFMCVIGPSLFSINHLIGRFYYLVRKINCLLVWSVFLDIIFFGRMFPKKNKRKKRRCIKEKPFFIVSIRISQAKRI